MRKLIYGIRFRILLLLFVTVFPLLLMVLYNGLEERRRAIGDAEQRVYNIARDIYHWQLLPFRMIYETLASVSTDPGITSLNTVSCLSVFGNIFHNGALPFCTNAGLINSQGYLVCGFLPSDKPVYMGDRDFFKSATESRSFSAGNVVPSTNGGKHTITFSHPVFNDNSDVSGVVFATVDLSWFNNISQHPFLFENATITLIDGKGVVVGRSSEGSLWAGTSNPDNEIVRKVLEQKQGVTQAVGLDGKIKIYGFYPLWPISNIGYVYVGVDRKTVLENIDRTVLINLVWLFLANTVGIILALVFSQKYILGNLNRLVQATKSLSKGKWDTRVGLSSDQGELAILGEALDRMAEELQEREKKQILAQKEILAERNFGQIVIESLPGSFYVFGEDLRFLRWNKNLSLLTGFSDEEIANLTPIDFFSGLDRETVAQAINEVFTKGEVTTEASVTSKDGIQKPFLLTGKLVSLEGRQCVVGMGIDITERKKTENSLKLEREQLLSIFDSINQLIFVIDPKDHNLLFANRHAIEFFGKDVSGGICHEQLVGLRTPCEFCPNEKVISLKGQPYEWEHHFPKVSKHFMIIDRMITWPDGREVKFELSIDITDRKKAEESLRKNEELLSTVLQTIPLGVWIADKSGTIIQVNPAGHKIWGCEEFPGIQQQYKYKAWRRDTGKPIEREEWALYKAVKYGETTIGEMIDIETFDGHKKVVLNSAVPIRDKSGQINGAIVINQDMTDRVIKDEALRETDQMMRVLIESSPIGIALTDGSRFVFCNNALASIFGYDSPDDIAGQAIEMLIAPEVREMLVNFHRERIAGKDSPSNYESKGLRRNGKIFDMSVWASVIEHKGQRCGLIFVTDVSEARELRSQLLHAQKMEAIGNLAGGIAHDFNNLLTVTSGYSELLLLRHPEGDSDHRELLRIADASRKASELVRQLLTFSRKKEVHFRPVEINREVENIVNMLSMTIPRMIRIDTSLSPDLHVVEGDPGQIGQALMNLCINASHAMPKGGTLSIGTSNVTLRETDAFGRIDINPGEYVRLSVSDTGTGIEKELVDRIFEPFFTTKGTSGTGLGLSIVHGIIMGHNGHISCETQPGHGTTFNLFFPVADESGSEKSDALEPAELRGGDETILYVDDEESIRSLWSQVLRKAGYTVLTAENGAEALSIYRDRGGDIDLVVLDVNMPVMGGRQCLEEILRLDRIAKVVIASGYGAEARVRELLELGAKTYISKPFDLKNVLETVRKVLDEKDILNVPVG